MAWLVTSLIVVPYDREQTISDRLTRKHGERFVYTFLSLFFSSVTRSRDTGSDRVPQGARSQSSETGCERRHARDPRLGFLKRTYLYVHMPSRAILLT